MSRHADGFALWLSRWGFATVVGFGAIAAVWVGWGASVPAEVPTFALQAAAIYRLEVASATFAAVYLAATALGLAVHNRAFSEIGMSGVKADDLGGSSRTIREHQGELLALSRLVAELRAEAKGAAARDRMRLDDN